MPTEIKPKKPWPLHRRKQLETLLRLLNECTSLNTGNQVIERMQRIIKAADKLNKTVYGGSARRMSLPHFLRNEALGEPNER